MTDAELALAFLAQRVLNTLTTLALATTKRDQAQAAQLHYEACELWETITAPSSCTHTYLLCLESKGAVEGAAGYLQYHADISRQKSSCSPPRAV